MPRVLEANKSDELKETESRRQTHVLVIFPLLPLLLYLSLQCIFFLPLVNLGGCGWDFY